jgi:hypothetical protein
MLGISYSRPRDLSNGYPDWVSLSDTKQQGRPPLR